MIKTLDRTNFTHALEDDVRSEDIVFRKFERISKAIVNMGLGRKMKYRINIKSAEAFNDIRSERDVAMEES